jgi:hypothetical protein
VIFVARENIDSKNLFRLVGERFALIEPHQKPSAGSENPRAFARLPIEVDNDFARPRFIPIESHAPSRTRRAVVIVAPV